MRPLTMMTRCSGETLESMASASKTSWPPQSSSTLVLCLGGGSVLLKQPPLMLQTHAICICCIRSYDSQFSFGFHNGNPKLLKRIDWRFGFGFGIRILPGPGVAVRDGGEMAAIMWIKEAWAKKKTSVRRVRFFEREGKGWGFWEILIGQLRFVKGILMEPPKTKKQSEHGAVTLLHVGFSLTAK